MDLKNIVVDKETLKSIVDNKNYNNLIVDYYQRFSNDGSIAFSKDLLSKKGERLDYCNKYWQLDKYEKQKIKDFKKTNLCHDKFCANCKKVRQAGRMAKYIPELEKYKGNLFHLILTVPNCSGQDLNATYKKMAKSFRRIIRYLDGTLKIKNIDFSIFDYQGAVRSLEVTFNGDSYHPHFHVAMVLNNDLFKLDSMSIINKYSYNNKHGYRELKRLFCKEEILIQKIWYLLMNDIKVTEKSIDDLEEGYSCMVNQFHEDDYAELFKYISKGADEKGKPLTYDNFISLYYGLYRIKQIQGYGCLYRLDDDIDLEELELQYDEYVDVLKQKESPVVAYETPQDLLLDTEYTLISRKSFFKYLRTIL